MGGKPRSKRTVPVLVEFHNSYENRVHLLIVPDAESLVEAEAIVQEELGSSWEFWGAATVERCRGCGGWRKAGAPAGFGHVVETGDE
jgi:hypothetical protein